jgi:FtsH-binding integral membrane protein
MGPSMLVVALLAGIILIPLLSEYGDLRRRFGLSRVAAFATTSLVVPAFAVGLTLALPLQSRPALQWVATVAGTLAVYSLAARAIAASASAAGTAPSRNTRG